jgi:PadR family transcriptional regulator PadR
MDIPVTARAALLQVLIRGPGYGLSLIDRVKEHTNGKIALNQGSVYPALRDMGARRARRELRGRVDAGARRPPTHLLPDHRGGAEGRA